MSKNETSKQVKSATEKPVVFNRPLKVQTGLKAGVQAGYDFKVNKKV